MQNACVLCNWFRQRKSKSSAEIVCIEWVCYWIYQQPKYRVKNCDGCVWLIQYHQLSTLMEILLTKPKRNIECIDYRVCANTLKPFGTLRGNNIYAFCLYLYIIYSFDVWLCTQSAATCFDNQHGLKCICSFISRCCLNIVDMWRTSFFFLHRHTHNAPTL